LEITTSTAKTDTDNLKNDTLLLHGGSINMGRNETMKEPPRLTHSVGIRSNTNVVIMCAPHRLNLETKGVRVFNRKLQQSMKIFTYVQMINMSKNRQYFKHSLQRNGLGEDWITSNLATEIRKLFSPKRTNSPIILNWKERSENQNQKGSVLYMKRNCQSAIC
jgi:hypothetical protein